MLEIVRESELMTHKFMYSVQWWLKKLCHKNYHGPSSYPTPEVMILWMFFGMIPHKTCIFLYYEPHTFYIPIYFPFNRSISNNVIIFTHPIIV